MEIRENIGELDTLVQVQACVIGTGDRGQKTYTFTNHSKVWARVEGSTDESIGNQNLESGQSLTVTMYKIAAMTSRWRIIIGGKHYSITGINPITRFSPLCKVSVNSIE